MNRTDRTFAYLAGLMLALYVLMTGCAGTRHLEGDTIVARVAVQYATLKVINQDTDRAVRVDAIAGMAIDVAEGGVTGIDELERQVRVAICWECMAPEDAMLAELLIQSVRAELDERIEGGLIDPERAAAATEVLTWVRDAARLVHTGPTGERIQ